MNIQLSVVLWTVICFLLLMLVLNNLIFRPVFKIMDERKKQLSEARQKKSDYARLIDDQKKMLEEQKLEAEIKRNEYINDTISDLQSQEKVLLKDAHHESLLRTIAYREQSEKELDRILSAVAPRMEQVAELFVKEIVSDGD